MPVTIFDTQGGGNPAGAALRPGFTAAVTLSAALILGASLSASSFCVTAATSSKAFFPLEGAVAVVLVVVVTMVVDG